MDIKDFSLDDSVILDLEMCTVVDIIGNRLVVIKPDNTRIVVNPSDLHF